MNHTIIELQCSYFFFFLRLNKKTTRKTKTITITTATTTATTISVQLKSPSLSCNSRGGPDLANNLGDVILLFKPKSYVAGFFDGSGVTNVEWSVSMESTSNIDVELTMRKFR